MFILPFIISLVFGLYPVILKIYLTTIPEEFVLLFSSTILFISSVLYSIYHKSNIIKGYNIININTIIILALTFFIASFICKILFLKTIHDHNVNITALIVGLAPAITIIASAYILNEKLNLIQILGCFLIFIGLFFIIFYKQK